MKLRNKRNKRNGELVYFGILLAFALLISLATTIINQIIYGDWTCTFKTCIVVKGGEE